MAKAENNLSSAIENIGEIEEDRIAMRERLAKLERVAEAARKVPCDSRIPQTMCLASTLADLDAQPAVEGEQP